MSPKNASSVAQSQRFLEYPPAKEYTHKGYLKAIENNPVLSGIPLVILSNILARVPALQSYHWHNAGFSSIARLEELKEIPVRFHPAVISLGPVTPSFVPFEEHLLSASTRPKSEKYYTTADYHAAYLSGAVTPLQVVDTLLPLIAQNQQPPGVYENGWVNPHDSVQLALEAAKASTERYAQGKPLSVLDGVPIGVKDDTDVEGWVNHWGMNPNMTNSNYKPCDQSLWPVMKLQEAGAIVVGKNRMHELGSETSGCNPSQGTPLNHHNNSYYTGGSTSGGASAVSAGIVPIVIGTDGGGSVRMPSANNGIYGLQPSHQRTVAIDWTMVRIGPLAATVADLTIAYRLMAQPDPACPIRKLYSPSQPLESTARRTIGISSEWWAQADPRVAELCRAAVDHLAAKKGYDVVEITIPFIQEGRLAHGLLCLAEISRSLKAHAPTNPSAHWLSHLNCSNKLLLSVATRSTTEDFMAANAMRELHMRHLAHLFEKHPNLLIVTPTAPIIGWPRVPNDDAYGFSDTNISIRNMMYVWLSNLTGTPAITAPVGFADPDQGEGKMPIGLMALGEWGAEEQLLGWAGELEEYLHGTYVDGRKKPETWFDVLAETEQMARK